MVAKGCKPSHHARSLMPGIDRAKLIFDESLLRILGIRELVMGVKYPNKKDLRLINQE